MASNITVTSIGNPVDQPGNGYLERKRALGIIGAARAVLSMQTEGREHDN